MNEATPPTLSDPSATGKIAPHLSGAVGDASLRRLFVHQLLETMWRPSEMEGKNIDDKLMASIAALDAVKPRDELESMLGVQMIATHQAALDCLRLALYDPASRDRNMLHASQFLKIYIQQLQALDRRHGTGGQQMSVGTVNVEPGAQAIVGNVAHASPAR